MVEFGKSPQPRHQPDEIDRPRGILSPRDRAYLLGEADVEPGSQTERNVRAAIRERVENAILDFTLLFDHLEDRDREKVFDDLLGKRPPLDADYITPSQGIIDAIAWFYLEHRTEHFRSAVREALRKVAQRKDIHQYIEVNIVDEPKPDIDELEQQARTGELSLGALELYFKDGLISGDEYMRLRTEAEGEDSSFEKE